MTSAKPRYVRQTGQFIPDTEFSHGQLKALRDIKNDDNFLVGIANIATWYKYLHEQGTERLSLPEIRATFTDLEKLAAALANKLDDLPTEIEAHLWQLRLNWIKKGIDIQSGHSGNLALNWMLHDLAFAINSVLDSDALPKKTGRNPAYLEKRAASRLVECFGKFGLPVTVNTWSEDKPTDAMICLEIIFKIGGKRLSNSALAKYLKPTEKKPPEKAG